MCSWLKIETRSYDERIAQKKERKPILLFFYHYCTCCLRRYQVHFSFNGQSHANFGPVGLNNDNDNNDNDPGIGKIYE